MKKTRLLYLIFSIIALILLTVFAICYTKYRFITVLLMICVVIPNYSLRNSDRNYTNNLILKYGFECDPYNYIDELKKYASKCFLNKKRNLTFDIYYALAYIDAGDFDDAKNLLLKVDDNYDLLDEPTKVLYFRGWCDYFYYQCFDVKLKTALLQLKDIIEKCSNLNMKNTYSFLYQGLEAKYYVLTGKNLEKAKLIYQNRRSVVPTALNQANINYILALVDIKEKKYSDAIIKLKGIANKNDSLYIVRKSQKLLKDMHE